MVPRGPSPFLGSRLFPHALNGHLSPIVVLYPDRLRNVSRRGETCNTSNFSLKCLSKNLVSGGFGSGEPTKSP